MRAFGVIAILLVVATAPASFAEPAAEHRAALTRYLTASRTHVVMRHVALPLSIREAAVDAWGFDGTTLGLDAILGMEAQVDEAALQATVLALHARHLPVDVASAAADFYDSDHGRRLLRATIGRLLPSSDPLFQPAPSPPSPEDQRALDAFIQSPAGRHLKATEARVTVELLQAIATTADRAVGDYVRVKGLPNKRRAR